MNISAFDCEDKLLSELVNALVEHYERTLLG